jgi:hypothetical protein
MRLPMLTDVMKVACMVTVERGEAHEFRTCEWPLNERITSMKQEMYDPDILYNNQYCN